MYESGFFIFNKALLQTVYSELVHIRQEITPEILQLLNETCLGGHGAIYQHLDTSECVNQPDNPIFFPLKETTG
jgi:hypothetical protein